MSDTKKQEQEPAEGSRETIDRQLMREGGPEAAKGADTDKSVETQKPDKK